MGKQLAVFILLMFSFSSMSLGIAIETKAAAAPEMTVTTQAPIPLKKGKHKLRKVGKRKKGQARLAPAENKRFVSALLIIVGGPFGLHRLYLGTDFRVPIIYTLTLGGGLGILPAIDLLLLVFSKDLESYTDNPRVFMFTK